VNRGSKDILLVLALATAGVFAALLPGLPELLRAPLVLPLALALPGYALIALLDPGRHSGGIERSVMSLGLSLALTILGGLLLNLTPWGLRREPWALLLGGLTLLFAVLSEVRRQRLVAAPATSAATPRPTFRLHPSQALLLGLAALLMTGAVGVARFGALNQPSQGFTQLWLQAVEDGAPGTVRLGVSNQEQGPMRYQLRVTSGEQLLGEWDNLELQPGARWEVVEALTLAPGAVQPIEATLYRDGEPEAYRSVHLYLGPAAAGQ
jgi:uncharacterized membrane protein